MRLFKDDPSFYEYLKSIPSADLKLWAVAAMWSYETTGKIPYRDTPEWNEMYLEWIKACFPIGDSHAQK